MRVTEENIYELLARKEDEDFARNSVNRIFGYLSVEDASNLGYSDIVILDKIWISSLTVSNMPWEEICAFVKKVKLFMSA